MATGSIPIQVNIGSGSFTANTTITLDVFNASLGAPAAGTAEGIGGYPANLMFPFQSSNLPASAQVFLGCAMDGLDCTSTSFMSTAAQLPVTIKVPSGLTASTHTLAITTTILGYSQTFQFPFNVGDFSGNLSTTSLTTKPGAPAPSP